LKTFIGIDIGSLATKIVLLENGRMIDNRTERSTYDFKRVGCGHSNYGRTLIIKQEYGSTDI